MLKYIKLDSIHTGSILGILIVIISQAYILVGQEFNDKLESIEIGDYVIC